MAKVDPYPAFVESLDAPISDDGQRLRIEHIEAPALRLEADESAEQSEQHRFAPLYEAIKHCLVRNERATVIRLFGLFGQPAETYDEIAQSSHIRYTSVLNAGYKARKKLRVALETHLTEMLLPKPAPEEEA